MWAREQARTAMHPASQRGDSAKAAGASAEKETKATPAAVWARKARRLQAFRPRAKTTVLGPTTDAQR